MVGKRTVGRKVVVGGRYLCEVCDALHSQALEDESDSLLGEAKPLPWFPSAYQVTIVTDRSRRPVHDDARAVSLPFVTRTGVY